MRPYPRADDYDGWVRQLAISYRRPEAKRHLMMAGPVCLPALRRGLHHPKPIVRRLCVNLLDRFADDATVPDLVAALDDDDPQVLVRALHALACDRCKQGECRPADQLFVPRAIELLAHPDPDVRAGAIDALGKVAGRRGDVNDVLVAAAESERDPRIRQMAARRARL